MSSTILTWAVHIMQCCIIGYGRSEEWSGQLLTQEPTCVTRSVQVKTIISAVTRLWQMDDRSGWGSSMSLVYEKRVTRCRLSLGLDTDTSHRWLMRLGRKNQSRTIKTSFVSPDLHILMIDVQTENGKKQNLSMTSIIPKFLETKGANYKNNERRSSKNFNTI